jgi:hypothetical protein
MATVRFGARCDGELDRDDADGVAVLERRRYCPEQACDICNGSAQHAEWCPEAQAEAEGDKVDAAYERLRDTLDDGEFAPDGAQRDVRREEE